MCKYMETKTVYANNYLFKIGDPDDSIYVVESGRVHVYITDEVNFGFKKSFKKDVKRFNLNSECMFFCIIIERKSLFFLRVFLQVL